MRKFWLARVRYWLRIYRYVTNYDSLLDADLCKYVESKAVTSKDVVTIDGIEKLVKKINA